MFHGVNPPFYIKNFFRNDYLCFAFISSAISFSSSSLMWSDIDSALSLDFLFRKENVLSLSRTLRLFGFGSDVVLMATPYWLLWDKYLYRGCSVYLEGQFRASPSTPTRPIMVAAYQRSLTRPTYFPAAPKCFCIASNCLSIKRIVPHCF